MADLSLLTSLIELTEGVSDPLDEIWNGPGISRRSVVLNWGEEFAKEINKKIPFLLKKKGGLPIDVAAADYGFQSDQDLMNQILSYIPQKDRYANWQKDFEKYLEQEQEPQDCPF